MKYKEIILASLLALSSASLYAANEWTSYQGNAAHTGYVSIKTNPEKFQKIWERKLGAENTYVVDGRPRNVIIADGYAFYLVEEYTSDHGGEANEISNQLIAIDTNSGKTVWAVDLSKYTPQASLHYVNGMILLNENKSIGPQYQSHILMFDAKSGKFAYSMYRPRPSDHAEADHSSLYETHSVLHEGQNIVSFNPKSARVNWQAQLGDNNEPLPRFVNGLAVSDHYGLVQIYNGDVHVLDRKTGTESITIKFDHEKYHEVLGLYGAVPVLDESTNTAYLVYERQLPFGHSLFALDLTQHGKIRWELPKQYDSSVPVVADNEVYSTEADRSHLNAVDAMTGKILWTWSPENDEVAPRNTPLATANVLFVSGKKNTYAVSRSTHQTIWKINVVGRMAIGDNKLFIRSGKCKEDRCTYDYVTAIALN